MKRVLSFLCFLLFSVVGQTSAQSAFNINLDAIRSAVVFLHRVDSAGRLQEAGTGFLIAVPIKSDPNRGYMVLVTARHIVDPTWNGCAQPSGSLVAVFNKKDFDPQKDSVGTIEVPLQPSWGTPEDDSVDIALTLLNSQMLQSLGVGNIPITLKTLPNPEELKKINTGAQIASAGLLLGASGIKRNYPIFKFGYVSSVPDEKIPVSCCPTCTPRLETEWMIAASLVPGNSGSPIFFVPVGFPGISDSGQRPVLLGVQSSSFIGTDVAGMAPISSILGVIEKLNLPDADLSIPGMVSNPAPVPSAARPPAAALPGPIPSPK